LTPAWALLTQQP